MDENQQGGLQNGVDMQKEGLKIGLLNGAFALLVMFVGYWMGIQSYLDIKMAERFVPYMIIILLITGFSLRKKNGGYLSFKQGLQFAFLSYVVAAIMIAVGTYVLYNLIDPELGKISFEEGLKRNRVLLEKLGTPEKEIESNLARARKAGSDTGFKEIFLGMGLGLIWDFMKSLLISLVIRKEKPAF